LPAIPNVTVRIIGGNERAVYRCKAKNRWFARIIDKLLQNRHGSAKRLPNKAILTVRQRKRCAKTVPK
jgi:hypothetical protein